MPTTKMLIPSLRYEDAPAAIEFLCSAFGFARHAVYADDADPKIVHHAQLTLGNSMLMLGSAMAGEAADRYRLKLAREVGGVTATFYVVIEDVEGHFATAQAAGAEIIRPPHDNEGYAGRGYECRDPEGNVWSFGSYDPFASQG